MYTSQNKWPASADRNAINVRTFTVPVRNGSVKVPLRAEVAPRLTAMIQWWDQNVEPVYTTGSSAGTWGYAYRTIKGYTTTLSNHASGTAIDINAPLHPLGKRNTVPADKAVAIRAKARELGLRWGGDYANRPDEMHFEINFAPTGTVAQSQTQSITSAATDTAALALEASKATARAAARDAKRKLQRNWIVVGVGLAAALLLFGGVALSRRKKLPALPAPPAANPRRRRRR
jgi:hypothetical protein